MSNFKAKMHQILIPLVLCSRPHCGNLQCSPATSKGREGKGGGDGARRWGRRDGGGAHEKCET